MIVEKENELGGYCRAIRKGEYIWDFAGHFFHFATKQWKEFFEDRIDQEEILRVKKHENIL